MARLTQADANVMDLVAPFAMSQPAITKHLNVLERAGLISRRKVGKLRRCRAEKEVVSEVTGWLENYRKALTANFKRLDALLETMANQ